jgi:hypothetical protein
MLQHQKALKRYDSGIGIDSQLILTDSKIEVKLLLVVRKKIKVKLLPWGEKNI